MTEPIKKTFARGLPGERRRFGSLAFFLMSAFLFVLLLRNAEFAIGHMSDGLRLCVRTLIPSLFPFMVLSELLISAGAAQLVGRLLPRPLRRLLGISRDGCCAALLGLLCGFPIGAKSAVSLYRAGRIDRSELCHLLTFSNTPSSAFLVSAVGVSLFGSRAFGSRLYTVTLLSALMTGIIGARFQKKLPLSEAPSRTVKKEISQKTGFLPCFTGAITSSALSMLYICAFVVFFSAFVGTVESMLQALSLPKPTVAFFFGLFELTGGVARAAACPLPLAEYLCAFLSGWSGLSVHCQIMSLCADTDVSFRPYLAAKLAQGFLNVLLLFASDQAVRLLGLQ